jgi:hypothetical protein
MESKIRAASAVSLCSFRSSGVITYIKSTANGLEKIDELVPGSWINIVDPTTDEIEQMAPLEFRRTF